MDYNLVERLGNEMIYDGFVCCPHCSYWSIVTFGCNGNAFSTQPRPTGKLASVLGARIISLLPRPPKTEAPEHVPQPVSTIYIDAVEILKQKRWSAAAGALRTTIDRATKMLWREQAGNDDWPKNLASRIESLRTKLDLPGAIVDWAHQVRIVGNEIHDLDEVTEEDAKDAGSFTEVFLTYTYTLPKRLASFRGRRSGPAEITGA